MIQTDEVNPLRVFCFTHWFGAVALYCIMFPSSPLPLAAISHNRDFRLPCHGGTESCSNEIWATNTSVLLCRRYACCYIAYRFFFSLSLILEICYAILSLYMNIFIVILLTLNIILIAYVSLFCLFVVSIVMLTPRITLKYCIKSLHFLNLHVP